MSLLITMKSRLEPGKKEEEMKRLTVITMVALLIVAMSGIALAGGTAQVNVSAQVVGTCKFSAASTNLPFGVLPFDINGNALGAGPITATIDFWCTKGAAYTITDDDGLWDTGVDANRMHSDTLAIAEYIDYTATYAPASGAGAGPGSPITLTVTGNVGATYGANSADTYSDTITLTIAP